MKAYVDRLEIPPVCFMPPDTGSVFGDWTPHIPFLAFLMYHLAPRRYVELGVLDGNSYFAACEIVKYAGIDCMCYGVDPWVGEFVRGETERAYSGDFYHRVLTRNGKYAHHSVLVRDTSLNAASQFAEDSIDLLHIDALHSYEAVKKDFDTWWPKVSKNGVVLMHDVLNVQQPGVGVFWKELEKDHKIFLNRFGQGLGVVFKGEDHPEQLRVLYESSERDREYMDGVFECMGALTVLAQKGMG